MDQTEHKLQTIAGLLAAFPVINAADGDAALRAYLIATNAYDPVDVSEGCRRLIAGEIAEHDGKYSPTPPQLARACRKAQDDRLDSERRRSPVRRLAAPTIEHTPESRARIAAMADAYVQKAAEHMRTEDAERDARQRDLSVRTDARFRPDMTPAAVRKRLGFGVGDQDDEAAA